MPSRLITEPNCCALLASGSLFVVAYNKKRPYVSFEVGKKGLIYAWLRRQRKFFSRQRLILSCNDTYCIEASALIAVPT